MEVSGKVILQDPIQAHGETITEITFSKPSTKDLVACGDTLAYTEDGSAFVRFESIARYIVRLGKIPKSSFDDLSNRDFLACKKELLNFLGQ